MAIIIRMPSVLAGASEATISKWLVKPGDSIAVGSPLAELETEKAVVDYNAEVEGTIGRLVLSEGASGEIGVPIAVLISPGEDDADIDAALGGEARIGEHVEGGAVADSLVPSTPPEEEVSAAALAPTQESAQEATVGVRTFASPIARKLARERGVDLSILSGTGPGGRIVRRDVESAAATPVLVSVGPHSPSTVAAVSSDSAEEIPLTPMRKAIARRLTESKTTVPHFYLTTECRVDDLLALREQINSYAPVRVSVNDLVVKAAAMAFIDVPEANVTWGESVLMKHTSIDISVAVSTEGGLVTPVVRNIAGKPVSEVSAEIKDLVTRAQDKRLRQEELEGGSFSISNLGMYGTFEFAAILNPPQSGILAIGAATEQPIVVDGELTVGKVMRCTLSADHRAIDGALAAQWLAAFTHRIENPVSLLV